MSSLEETMRANFLADSTVSSLIDQRLYAMPAPHVSPVPFVTYQLVGQPEGYQLDGVPDLATARIQYNCVSDDWLVARQVLEALRTSALRDVMKGVFSNIVIDSIFVADKRDMGIDVDTALYRHDLDLEIWLQIQ